MPRNFVGFYWTLPVPRVGFTRLPEDAAEAAAQSRTIRYQRDLVHRFVRDEGVGRLIAEFVWLELAFDRGSAYVDTVLDKAFAACREHEAHLVYVDFGQRSGWRIHHHLRHRLNEAEVPIHGLDPERLPGEDFDPIRHFEEWRRRFEELRDAQPRGEALRETVREMIVPFLPPETPKPDYASAAAFLNREGIRSTTDRQWTRDNLRMFLRPAARDVAVQPKPPADP